MLRSLTVIFYFLPLSFCNVYASSMKVIPKGFYRPLYVEPIKKKDEKDAQTVLKRGDKIPVQEFLLDTYPTTRRDFKKFLVKNPEWRSTQVKRIFADASYLSDWKSDDDPGNESDPESPVRYVSWFAARAFCSSQGKRLPTLSEWEYAAASYKKIKNLPQKILDWYSRPTGKTLNKVGSTVPNDFGIYDLHGLLWEWVEDFNSNLVTGESRADSSLEQVAFCGSGGLNAANFDDYAAFMRFGFRSSLSGSFTIANLGFRCAKDKGKK